MAARTTSFPDGRRMAGFRALEAILREDPVLAANVRTWSTWDGAGNDAMPASPGMCPFLQLSPVMLPNERMGVTADVANVGVRVTLAVAGLVAEDIVDFWDAVEAALVRGKPFRGTTVLCFLESRGVNNIIIQQPAVDAWRSAEHPPDTFLKGTGLVLLKVRQVA